MRRRFGRRLILLLLIALMATGCTRTIAIPVDQLGNGSRNVTTPHRIRMVDGSQYVVREFSVTDSTLALESLSHKDQRYKKADLPIIIPLRNVRSVEKIEAGPGVFVGVAIVGVFIALGIGWASGWSD